MRTSFPVWIGALALAAIGSSAARAAAPALPAPTAIGVAGTCLTSPCANDFSLSAGQTTSLANFGRNYTVTTVDESHNPTVFNTIANTPGEVTVSGAGGTSTALVKGTPFVSINSFAAGGQGIAEEAALDYDFEVIDIAAPATRALVNIGVTGKGEISGTTVGAGPAFSNGPNVFAQLVIDETQIGFAQAAANFSVAYYLPGAPVMTSNSSTPNVVVDLGTTSTFKGGFSVADQSMSVITGIPNRVSMVVEGDASGLGGTSISGFVDPMISVPAGYELILSPGIGVPEPASWALMLVGFGGLGAMLRRQRDWRSPAQVGDLV